MNLLRTFSALLLVSLPAVAVAAKPLPDHWVSTWATASFAGSPLSPNAPSNAYIPGAADVTLRQLVHTSLAGPLVRVEFTNAFGTEPLTIGAAHITLAGPGFVSTGDLQLLSANALTFNGVPSITIPPGGEVTSDPAALTLPAGADLVISLFLPAQKITTPTLHGAAFQTGLAALGNVVGQRSITPDKTFQSWYFLKSVDVKTLAATSAIVALGDSITDGSSSTPNTNQRWPDQLARRLQAAKATRTLAVLNEGIGGNRVLHENTGPDALSRFDRDVLSLPGVRFLILLEGINDIGWAHGSSVYNLPPSQPVTSAEIIAGLSQLAERAHTHDIKVFGATLTPYNGAPYFGADGEQTRQEVNAWIRTSRLLDGVIDFDKATQGTADPTAFNPAFDSGDHLHPNDAGLKAMADAIDLKLFTAK